MKIFFTFTILLFLTISLTSCKSNNFDSSTSQSPTNDICEHTYLPATCLKGEICSKCGITKGSPLGHNMEILYESNKDIVYLCSRDGCKETLIESKNNTIKIYLYLTDDWANTGAAYFNGVLMEASPDSNGRYYIEVEAESITTMDLDFEQTGCWFHVVTKSATGYNSDSASISVNMVKGKTYQVTNINWKSDDPNGIDKYYYCEVKEIK